MKTENEKDIKEKELKKGENYGWDNVNKTSQISPFQILGLALIFIGLYLVILAFQIIQIPNPLIMLFYSMGLTAYISIFFVGLGIALIGTWLFLHTG